jgi:3-methyladenine DNA glycosylase/8-oxoguanine DNA glycosylase
MLTRTLPLPDPFDLRASLAGLVASAHDPTIRLRDEAMVRSAHTPEGPATLELRRHGRQALARAWGSGASWALDRAPGLLGAHDDLAGFEPHLHAQVARAHHDRPGLRLPRTGSVVDVLVPTILAQRVTAREAARSWTRIVRRFGDPAPGPHGLLLPPSPARMAAIPDGDYHRLGVERTRAATIRRACRRIARLQEAVDLPHEQAMARMTAVPGLGPWTAALVLRLAAGDPDAVEVGDYHVKNHVAWSLAGRPRGTDAFMLELLEPFRGHRGRVVTLLLARGPRAPKRGPRARVVPVDQL